MNETSLLDSFGKVAMQEPALPQYSEEPGIISQDIYGVMASSVAAYDDDDNDYGIVLRGSRDGNLEAPGIQGPGIMP